MRYTIGHLEKPGKLAEGVRDTCKDNIMENLDPSDDDTKFKGSWSLYLIHHGEVFEFVEDEEGEQAFGMGKACSKKGEQT
ncbi:hypothetical protein U1Q18_037976 [Sarracenia purpurea var. burkii]